MNDYTIVDNNEANKTADLKQNDDCPQLEPLQPKLGESAGLVVWFSSVTENTARFIDKLQLSDAGIESIRLPLRKNDPEIYVDRPYVLVTPTYGGGDDGKAIPRQVAKFLNDQHDRSLIRGVIGSGNINFYESYCAAADQIARKCGVPLMYRFELAGTPQDVEIVRTGLTSFFKPQTEHK